MTLKFLLRRREALWAAIVSCILSLSSCDRADTNSSAGDTLDQIADDVERSRVNGRLREEVSTVPPSVEVLQNIEYAQVDEQVLYLDLYLPKQRDELLPLLIWIHGGGWSQGTKNWSPLVWLSDHGYAIASVEYRLSGVAQFPAQIHDCKSAVRWLRANAGNYGIDPQRVGIGGLSAGGHLAALVGTSGDVNELEGSVGEHLGQSSRVQAVVSLCGASDFQLILDDYPDYAARDDTNCAYLFGGPLTDNVELAKLASPVTHVTEDDPPLLMLHGSDDTLVPIKQSHRLRDVYRESQLTVSLKVIPGGEHGPAEFWDQEHRNMVREFFDKHLAVDD